jgi:hypothetical protein
MKQDLLPYALKPTLFWAMGPGWDAIMNVEFIEINSMIPIQKFLWYGLN